MFVYEERACERNVNVCKVRVNRTGASQLAGGYWQLAARKAVNHEETDDS